MKKIFFSLLIFFAASSVSFAQEKNAQDPYVMAKVELNELVKVIPLDNSLETSFFNLLLYKHETLAKATTEKEKNDVYNVMKSKIDSTFSSEVLKKLKNNKALYENLIK